MKKYCLLFSLLLIIFQTNIIWALEAADYYNKGFYLYKSGQYEQTLEAFHEAIKLNPNDSSAYINKGVVLEILGKFNLAIELDPNNPVIQKNKQKLLNRMKFVITRSQISAIKHLHQNYVATIDFALSCQRSNPTI
ncbi:tetratricopeptide repeat protein [Candidatus Rickettsia tasmanensis]